MGRFRGAIDDGKPKGAGTAWPLGRDLGVTVVLSIEGAITLLKYKNIWNWFMTKYVHISGKLFTLDSLKSHLSLKWEVY